MMTFIYRIGLLVVAAFLALAPGVTSAEIAGEQTAEPAQSGADAGVELNASVLGLWPEELDGASRYRTRAQQMVADLVAAGETDLDILVAEIVADHREVLDHLVVNLASQRVYECNIDGEVLRDSKVSTGRRGYETPVGEYRIVNKAPKAYSEKYEAWMLHWMGLTRNGEYGMHGLEGSSYERLLGKVASHGCVRLSREYAKSLYPRIYVDMPVLIVDDANLDLRAYEPLSHQAAVAMVLDVLSPNDPWDVYY